MTCIVGMRQAGQVWLGGDSLSGDPATYHVKLERSPKVFRLGELLIGHTSSWRMGQLLHYRLWLPPQTAKQSDDAWLATTFIDAVRKVLTDGGFAKKENNVEQGGTFLLAFRGKLYEVDSDYQVGEPGEDYAAIGAGRSYAVGALQAMHVLQWPRDPRARIRTALQAAAYHSAYVRAPFRILRSP